MKVVIQDEWNILIYLRKSYVGKIDFKDREQLEEQFKKLFLTLKENYNLYLSGYYNISVYHDPYYGMILRIEKEDLDYYDFYDNQVDMRITVEDHIQFVYHIEDYFSLGKELLENCDVLFYHNQFYLRVKKELSEVSFGKLLEISDLNYQDTKEIIRKGTLIQQ